MSIQRKFFYCFIFLCFDAFLLIGYLEIREATMQNDFKKEIAKISSYDLSTDRYNTKIQTRGKYAVAEKVVKGYLDHLAVLLQDTITMVRDQKLTHILSYENYQKDGPEFEESLQYLKKQKKKYNEKMDMLLKGLEEEKMEESVDSKVQDSIILKITQDAMNRSFKGEFQETKSILEQNREKVNRIYDTSIEVLEFLKKNKDSWVLEDGEIKFQTDALYQQYLTYIKKITS